jgi:hypothetical protein
LLEDDGRLVAIVRTEADGVAVLERTSAWKVIARLDAARAKVAFAPDGLVAFGYAAESRWEEASTGAARLWREANGWQPETALEGMMLHGSDQEYGGDAGSFDIEPVSGGFCLLAASSDELRFDCTVGDATTVSDMIPWPWLESVDLEARPGGGWAMVMDGIYAERDADGTWWWEVFEDAGFPSFSLAVTPDDRSVIGDWMSAEAFQLRQPDAREDVTRAVFVGSPEDAQRVLKGYRHVDEVRPVDRDVAPTTADHEETWSPAAPGATTRDAPAAPSALVLPALAWAALLAIRRRQP